MKEHPILFNGEMVKAILEGRKTQTRRVVKGLPNVWTREGKAALPEITCPYGRIGDRLWVRETGAFGCKTAPIYRADLSDDEAKLWRFTPSIHMPRWASRINLEITDIRIERLQNISVTEIEAEGMTVELFESLLYPIAKKLKVEEPHWICHHEMGECGTFCFKCGEKRRKQLLKTATEEQKHNLDFLDGGWTIEFDSPPRCETCEMPLHYNPTDYCFEEEMSHFIENGCYPNPLDAYEMLALTGTTNCHNKKDTQDFLKIAWPFLWNSINGKPRANGIDISWGANPFVWVPTFKVLK